MEGFELIKQGAEARIYKGEYLGKPAIAKHRFEKTYRVQVLDERITKTRIRAEGRAILGCTKLGLKTPTLYLVDFDRRTIIMEYFVHSVTVKDFLDKNGDKKELLNELALRIGEYLFNMYQSNITHGDLTTSNMLLVNRYDKDEFDLLNDLDLVFIDFGLASTDSSFEDKAVDLYVLERALISTHKDAEEFFRKILDPFGNDKATLKKYMEVRARGRKRTMIG